MNASLPPSGDLYACLTYNDAEAAIEYLCSAFGFTQRLLVPGPEGKVMHSELSLGSAVIMVSSPKPEMERVSPRDLAGVNQSLSIHVDDPDSHFAAAKTAGVTILQELQDEEFGSRGYMAKDLEGHVWYFGTYQPGEYWES